MRRIFSLSLHVCIIVSFIACSSTPYQTTGTRDIAATGDARGSVANYDPGPPKDSKWPDIFAETPNYRAYGKAIYQAAAKKAGIKDDGQEKFRWKVGPMWYRGRLTPNNVKIFVIGQEGAQDENTSNRTFTGSTGTKMQNFINYFGVNQSYLFMNTFIYTITGQYGERAEETDSAEEKKAKQVRSSALFWLAQNPKSVVVQHRHKMFDYMLSQNEGTLALVIGVGAAGRDSVATWIKSHGGECQARQLLDAYCNADVLAKGVKAIAVPHPGAASARNGGASGAANLKVKFPERAQTVAKLIQENANWLKPDRGMRPNFSKAYEYEDASIPHQDFAFGTTWRLGKDGTSTNRRGADGIQVFSAEGCYNNAVRLANGRCDPALKPKTVPLQYEEPTDLESVMDMAAGDVPWESPKSRNGRRIFDEGPGEFATVLAGEGAWPDFKKLGVTASPSFGTGPIYRGNLENPEVLVLADQESHDDLFSTRALTGTGGQKLQTFLSNLGVGRNYAIVRTLPVDTTDLPKPKALAVATDADVVKVRGQILNKLLKQGKTKLVLTVGDVAAQAIKEEKPGVPVVNLDSPLSTAHVAQWKKAAGEIKELGVGITPRGTYDGSLTAIPREDLPAHTRWWMGTSGSRGSRAYVTEGRKKQWSGDYYKFEAPTWVNEKKYPANPRELSATERASVDAFSKDGPSETEATMAGAEEPMADVE
jgi:uracil-DNA glycosylase